MLDDALDAAADLVEQLAQLGHKEYAAHVNLIAEDLFQNGLLQGHWDTTVYFESRALKAIRCINEDEYEQHMDHSENKPEWDDMICSCEFGYVWLVPN